MRAAIKERSTGSCSSRAFRTWLLLDYTKFAVSRLRDAELAKSGLTPEQGAILQILVAGDGKSTIPQISEAWMRQPNSVSTLINRMEKQGLVTKTRKPKQKVFEISITAKGSALHQKIPGVIIEDVFSALSAEDMQKFSQYLTLLFVKARNLQGMNKNFTFLF